MESTIASHAEPDSLPEIGPSLASIVAPIGVNDFLERYWRRSVFFCAGSPRRLGSLLRELGPTDIGRLLWQSQHYVVLWPRPTPEHGALRLSMAAALEAHDKRGATLYFRMKEHWPLARWTAALAEELGEPSVGVTAFFAVRGDSGTQPHLDCSENFTIQLIGTKRWRVAPNEFVTNPITNWTIGDPPPPYAHSADRPTEMPPDAQEHLLTPGSVLYVPRGYLHHVTAVDSDASLSFNMGFPPNPWALILCTLLSNRLFQDPEFREDPSGAFGTGWGRKKVLELLPAKLAGLTRHAAEIGNELLRIMDDPESLKDYLARRTHPRY